MNELSNLRVAVLTADGFEESELLEPVAALKKAGASVTIASLRKEAIQGVKHMERAGTVAADCTVAELESDEF